MTLELFTRVKLSELWELRQIASS